MEGQLLSEDHQVERGYHCHKAVTGLIIVILLHVLLCY